MFHRRYSHCRPQNSARYNRITCLTVENTSFVKRLSCILHAFAKGYTPVTGTSPTPGRCGALAMRQTNCQHPNQMRINPAQGGGGASSVSVSPIVSLARKVRSIVWRVDPYRNQDERECERQTAAKHAS